MKNSKLLDVIASISLAAVIILSSAIAILNTRLIYYFDIAYCDIPAQSGLSISEIKENYNYTINFTNDNSITEFKPPTLPSSADGSEHFIEVRQVFNMCKYIIGVLGVLSLIIFFIRRTAKLNILKYTSYILLGFPILLALAFGISFNTTFVIFHKLLFSNSKWLLDPATDPIINIMPEDFFMHSGIGILALAFFAGIILLALYRVLRQRK